MVLSEKVVTASMLEAMMLRILSTASAPTRADNDQGMASLNRIDARAVATPRSENNAARSHNFFDNCVRVQRQRAIMGSCLFWAPGRSGHPSVTGNGLCAVKDGSSGWASAPRGGLYGIRRRGLGPRGDWPWSIWLSGTAT